MRVEMKGTVKERTVGSSPFLPIFGQVPLTGAQVTLCTFARPQSIVRLKIIRYNGFILRELGGAVS